ncbi:threonine dehydratase [Mycobacteroides abscessus subsp. bolletii 1S-154-0310]|nr:threonine dehydratase [Mycobacteroides abscessus 5S-0817]EIU70631.1 threonine dehydratase [Mycobacteroides abscessus subsp. bolletii 1S-152-0914]EIU84388.1 threonine dehydratase [Mycobacteroides abscessus subsp. bolletii 1S-154-0310]EIU86338.1 threonine dehydratase [Mycobacteroides abscessus subsp. bolletii 2B-0626]EIU99023.1 threonine dehydratase [Mycobacteroides abscessus 5S-0921]EIV15654.1 threonine dehydratase [Mycobacteroides abscessus subsp. bolletii 2B-0307]ETZ80817.1 threonine ammo
MAFRALSDRCGHEVRLKCENLQRTGSFKPRGAYNRISQLPGEQRVNGVVAASAGNHAQGVAWAATTLGIPSTVFMPVGAALPKIVATRAYGATVHLTGSTIDDALLAATEFAAETGAVLIHPFDHRDVVAGQATVGLEILEQLPEVGTIVVPAGGGGLVAGVAAVVKAARPEVRIVAVQAAGAAAWPVSLQAGHPVALESMDTMADGIAVGKPGAVPFEHVAALVDDVVTVSEEALSRGLLLCLERAKLVVEPAGAAAVAALLTLSAEELGLTGPVCAVLSGGNIDPLLLTHVITHGLRAAGRYLTVRVTVADAPGGLSGLLDVFRASGASVVDVTHWRNSERLRLGEVDVLATVETRGPEHRQAVLDAIVAAGLTVQEER